MNKILIISDTHGNKKIMRRVLEMENDVGIIFHLGDNYEDLNDNYDLTLNKEIHKVPGIFHKGYLDKSLPGILKIEKSDWHFLLVHNVEDVLNREIDVDFIFYGHTHHWKVQKMNSTFFINPGHMKDIHDKGRIASYCRLDFNDDILNLNINDINGKELHREKIKRSDLEDK